MSFKDLILQAMSYGKLRSEIYPLYFHKIGIKTCVYCNSQLTISIDPSRNGEITKAKFEIDHFYPQHKYPCFSLSFFNLYPVCGVCNLVKHGKDLSFELYSDIPEETKISRFKFGLKEGSVARYLISGNPDDIRLTFTEPGTTLTEKGPFQKMFDIEGIYDTQKDLAEELILKSRVYKVSYKRSLIRSFPGIFTSASLSNRLIIGNYSSPEEIHKRPMAKFTQDIAKQLKLI